MACQDFVFVYEKANFYVRRKMGLVTNPCQQSKTNLWASDGPFENTKLIDRNRNDYVIDGIIEINDGGPLCFFYFAHTLYTILKYFIYYIIILYYMLQDN